ncbi:hypothetical protein ACIQ1D_18420 [Lysinibacillus xylanilyticus]|uniref:hypothetical protein n=1 Tax=Lysinibacillus xylanilyticus TaxID=582475 RepID=UPI003828ADBC
MGFDGVLFKSSVGKGYNVVIFDFENVDYVTGTGEVFEVEALKYTIKQQKHENYPDNVTHTIL